MAMRQLLVALAVALLQPGYSQTNTWQQPTTSGTAPSARDTHAAVWAGDQMLTFGGFDGSNKNDLHSYNAQTYTWALKSPSGTAPTARNLHSAVYAASLPGVLIFGGVDGSFNLLNDLQLYKTQDDAWETPSTTGTPPSAREKHSAVYTGGSLQAMLIFGGVDGTFSDLGDVHHYLVQTRVWQQPPSITGTPPTARGEHSAVWAESLQGMLIFGGSAGGSVQQDLHLYLPGTTTWQALSPTGTKPAARKAHSAVWVQGAYGIMVIFGGEDGSGSIFPPFPPTRFDDLHIYNSEANMWQQLTPTNTGPSARQSFTAVYAESLEKMLLFAGFDGSRKDDVWEYAVQVPTSTTTTTTTVTVSSTETTVTSTSTTETTSTVTTATVTTSTLTSVTTTVTSMTLSTTTVTMSTTSTSVVEVGGCIDGTFSGSRLRLMIAAFKTSIAKAAGVSEDMVEVFWDVGSVCLRVPSGRRLQNINEDEDQGGPVAMTFVIRFPSALEETANETRSKLETMPRQEFADLLAAEVSQVPELATSQVSVLSTISVGSVETLNANATTTEPLTSVDEVAGLDGGIIAAIVVGAVVLLCCLVVVVFVACKKRKKSEEAAVTKYGETQENIAKTTEEGFGRPNMDL